MTGDPLLDLAISVGGIALLAAAFILAGATRRVTVTEANAGERLAFDEPDFSPAGWIVSGDGKAAATTSRDGRETAVVFAAGDGLVTRRFRHGAVSLEKHGTEILLMLNEPSKRRVRLVAPSDDAAEEWILRLAGPRL